MAKIVNNGSCLDTVTMSIIKFSSFLLVDYVLLVSTDVSFSLSSSSKADLCERETLIKREFGGSG